MMLTTALFAGLAAAGLTSVLRALAPVSILTRKPLSCDLCMSFWGSLIAVGATIGSVPRSALPEVLPTLLFASVAVSLVVLKVLTRLRDLSE